MVYFSPTFSTLKKILIGVLVIGALGYAIKWTISQYDEIEGDLYANKTQKDSKVAEKVGVTTSDLGAPRSSPPASSAPSAPASTSVSGVTALPPSNISGVRATSQSNIVVCTREVNAYDPTNPPKLLGKFLKDSTLQLGAKDPVSGMVPVVYKQEKGPDIRALCTPQDVGR